MRFAPVQSISCDQGRVSDNGVREQFGFLFHYLGFVKLKFPLDLKSLACPLYLLHTRHICSWTSASVSPPIVFTSLKGWHVQPWLKHPRNS
jgi:hypothetical protein